MGLIVGVVIGVGAQDSVLSPLAASSAYVPNAGEQSLSALYTSVSGSTVNVTVAAGRVGLGTGSGFVIDSAGHIVTNNHVVEQARYIEVTFINGTTVEAELIGRDPGADLAVIKVDPNTPGVVLQPVTFADSDTVFVGEDVIAIGSPFGQNFTLTSGIISAVDRQLQGDGRFSIPEVIQTDAAINPGNSGGPLLNMAGEVLGVNTAILSETGFGSGVGFSIPSNTVRRIVPYLIANGEYEHSFLGITGTSLGAAQREAMNLPADFNGVMISDVTPQGPAAQAGLQGTNNTISTPLGELPVQGDIIIAIDGAPVVQMPDLIGYLEANTQPGSTVTLSIWRDGQTMDMPVTLQERPTSDNLQ
jgi:2-alkenal reductase